MSHLFTFFNNDRFDRQRLLRLSVLGLLLSTVSIDQANAKARTSHAHQAVEAPGVHEKTSEFDVNPSHADDIANADDHENNDNEQSEASSDTSNVDDTENHNPTGLDEETAEAAKEEKAIQDDDAGDEVTTKEKALSPSDTKALSMLKTADDHRNHRLHFSLEQSLTEAIRLYDAVVVESLVSPDLKARAKINLAKIYVMLSQNHSNAEIVQKSKEEILQLINGVLLDTEYSEDMKGWARRFQAKLYQFGFYTADPKAISENALLLLNANLVSPQVGEETKARTRMQMANGYLSKVLITESEDERTKKARDLFEQVANDHGISADMRAKAHVCLGTYMDFYHNQSLTEMHEARLKHLESALYEEGISSTLAAHIRALLATNYLMGVFSVTPAVAREHAEMLLEETAKDENLSDKLRLFYTVKLAEHYLNTEFNIDPEESRQKALKLYNDLKKNIAMTPEQSYEYRSVLAGYHARNAFRLDPEKAKEKALEIYNELINDSTLIPKHKAEVRWIVANLYASNLLVPVGEDSLHASMTLFKQVLNDMSIPDTMRNSFKMNLIDLCTNNIFGIERSKELMKLVS